MSTVIRMTTIIRHEHAHGAGAPHVHGRSLSKIEEIIRGSALADGVKATALKAFHLLGHAEAKIHNVPVETIHFHEVGAVDAIADIVGVSAGMPLARGGALDLLSAQCWRRSCALRSREVSGPCAGDAGVAARLACLFVRSEEGVGHSDRSGAAARARCEFVGLSGDEYERDRLRRGIKGHRRPAECVAAGRWRRDCLASRQLMPKDRVGIIETTIDDATPEFLSYVADCLLAAGASDVYRTPVQMKKGRIGTQLTILCSPAKAEALQKLVFLETTTLGLRYREEEKKSLARSSDFGRNRVGKYPDQDWAAQWRGRELRARVRRLPRDRGKTCSTAETGDAGRHLGVAVHHGVAS